MRRLLILSDKSTREDEVPDAAMSVDVLTSAFPTYETLERATLAGLFGGRPKAAGIVFGGGLSEVVFVHPIAKASATPDERQAWLCRARELARP